MILASVSMRVSPEAYKKIRELADKRNVTLVEAADFLLMDYEIDIQKLKEENAKLKEELKKAPREKRLTLKEIKEELEKRGFFRGLREIYSGQFKKNRVQEFLNDFFGVDDVNLHM